MSYEEGAMIEPLAVAVHGVKQMGDVAGMSIAVLGAGPIGNLVAQAAKGMGAAKMCIRDRVLAELSAEHREFFENYMDIVDHAHFQEEQRAYYQGMVDVMQIFDGLGILKERNKVKEVLMHIKK